MRKLYTTIIALGVIACQSIAQTQPKDPMAWNKLEVFRINKEAPTAFFISYPDFNSATKPISIDDIANIYSGESYKSLNGDWKFLFLNSVNEVKEDFFAKNFDDSKWNTIDVPNSWQMRGYDHIFYTNITVEFFFDEKNNWIKEFEAPKDKNDFAEAAKNPFIPEMYRQVGVYRRNFTIPEDWNGKQIFVRFDGVRTGFNLYVNGKFVGYSEDSFTPAEFDLTNYIEKGENSIVAEVFKFTTGAYMEMQDMPHVMGIIRDVTLIARPEIFVCDYYAPAKLSADMKSADINLDVWVKNTSKSAKTVKLSAYIMDSDGKIVGEKPLSEKDCDIAANSESKVSELVKFDDFKLWSPDSPNLYYIILRLNSDDGKELETIKADYAFRKFEIDGRKLFLNGKRLLIKGVNRHDWSPDKGKAVDFHWQKKDVELMKRANMNFVRTSHYPNESRFYMLCNRYGLAVLDEANQEMHGFVNNPPLDMDNFVPPSIDRLKNMIMRDRNIPCVMIFSLGNESAVKPTTGHAKMAEVARKLDSRPVHSEPECRVLKDGKAGGCSDFFSPMYGGVARMNHYLTNLKNEKRPYFYCEYAHAMGNSIGNLKEMWELIRSNKDSLNGGFVWDWVDQAAYWEREDGYGKYLSDGRDWSEGKRRDAQNFCSNGIIFADRTYGSKYFEVKKIYQDIQIDAVDAKKGDLKLTNEFFATNLDQFTPVVSIEHNGKVIAIRILDKISLAAGETKNIHIDFPKFDNSKVGEYFYTLKFLRDTNTDFAKAGEVLAENQFVLENKKSEAVYHSTTTPKFKEEGGKIIVTTSNSGKIVFNKLFGELESYEVRGEQIITSPVAFDIESALIDNYSRGNLGREMKKHQVEKIALKESSCNAETEGNTLKVVCNQVWATPAGEGFKLTVVYRVLGDGVVKVDASCAKINDTIEDFPIARLGLKMGVSKDLNKVEFFGKGPFANYNDRGYAAHVGKYKSKVSDWYEDFTRPQDTGNREDVRWLALRDKIGCGIMIVSRGKNLPMSILPWTQAQIANAKHTYLLPESSQNELRIAWKVRGLGNNACGPDTLEQYKCKFVGSVDWSFDIVPLYSNTDSFVRYQTESISDSQVKLNNETKNISLPKYFPKKKEDKATK